MKSKISKAHRAIVQETFARWEENVYVGTPDIEKAKTCIRAGYTNGIGSYRSDRHKNKTVTFHTVESPVAFMIAVSVVRGRMNKKYAVELCALLGIDAGFLKNLRRDSLARWNSTGSRWWHNANNEFSRTWLRAIRAQYLSQERRVTNTVGIRGTLWRSRFNMDNENATLMYNTNNLSLVIPILTSLLNDTNALESFTREQRGWDGRLQTFTVTKTGQTLTEIASKAIWNHGTTASAIGEMSRAIDIQDVIRGSEVDEDNSVEQSVYLGAVPKAIDAEILSRILKIDDPAMTWEYEVFHHCTGFAAFQNSCVILASRPTLCTNEEGNLHNTTGAAVSWGDGTRLWFNDGHYMEEGGKYIVEKSDQLSTAHILRISNEETRRLAIESFGWDRFIAEAGCPVLDRRLNDIDNTIEMLVGSPAAENTDAQIWRRGPNRMVLFCRSTGRRYFLSVPNDIEKCEEAQAWMADAEIHENIPYASRPMRLLGAS
jgi:hypothetical protein